MGLNGSEQVEHFGFGLLTYRCHGELGSVGGVQVAETEEGVWVVLECV